MNITIAPVGLLGTNCYIVTSEEGGCFVVDPGAQPVKILQLLEEKKLTPKYILLTHGHYDHIGGVRRLLEAFPEAELYIGEGDYELLSDPKKNYILDRGLSEEDYHLPQAKTVSEGHIFELDELEIGVLATPGHTKGGVCYLCGEVIFSGDTLFLENCGRCDLYGGDFEVMKESLARLAGLEGDYTVYPGHGESTSMEHERGHNPYIR